MPLQKRKLRIVIVENELLLRLLAEDLVIALGHDVVGWAHSADEAVELADRSQPDLILMDIQLGGHRDGIEAAKEIKNRFGIASCSSPERAIIARENAPQLSSP